MTKRLELASGLYFCFSHYISYFCGTRYFTGIEELMEMIMKNILSKIKLLYFCFAYFCLAQDLSREQKTWQSIFQKQKGNI